jgi:plasmid stabilization system protein ParE
MKSGYRIKWTDNALSELQNTFDYIEVHWTNKELKKLAKELDKTIELIVDNPKIFPLSNRKNIRKAVVRKLNTIYYHEIKDGTIEVLSFFSNRQSPSKRKI